MKNKAIHLVCTTENCAEAEYIKEFFNYIGCFFTEKKFNLRHQNDWLDFIKLDAKKYDIEIIVNYFGDEPYLCENVHQRIKRIYCYFSFENGFVKIVNKPLSSPQFLNNDEKNNKKTLRKTVLNDLTSLIWKGEPDIEKAILNIVDVYTDNPCGDLFHFLQLRHSFDFLLTNDARKFFSNDVPLIKFNPYLLKAIKTFYFVSKSLETCDDPYSQYAKINSDNIMYSFYQKIKPTERHMLQEIYFPFLGSFHLKSQNDIISMLKKLLHDNPNFLSAYLLMAKIYQDILKDEKSAEFCYISVLNAIQKEQKDYAFIWFQCGEFFKKNKDIETAIKFYKKAIKVEPEYYPALLEIAYFDAFKGEFDDANRYLNKASNIILCNKSIGMDGYENFEYMKHLSLEDCLYFFRINHLLLKIALRSAREYSAKSYVDRMSIAAVFFKKLGLIQHISTLDEYSDLIFYHSVSEPVLATLEISKSITDGAVRSEFANTLVRNHIAYSMLQIPSSEVENKFNNSIRDTKTIVDENYQKEQSEPVLRKKLTPPKNTGDK